MTVQIRVLLYYVLMKTYGLLRIALSITLIAVFTSCAGIQEKTTAQSEFEAGMAYFNKGQHDDAIKHFIATTELNPELGKAYLYLGRSYLNLGRWREALPPLRTALRIVPEETKKEIADILLDIILRNASEIDQKSNSEIMDLLKQ